jgi:restriction system protein
MNSGKTRVRLGDRIVQEQVLLAELSRVQDAIQNWAIARELWHDSSFATPFIYHREPPRSHDTILLISEGPLGRIFGLDGAFSDCEEAFTSLLDNLGYWFEMENHYTMSLYPTDDRLRDDLHALHRWQWLQGLANRRMVTLHAEVFEYFAKNPDDLKRIGWRQFEELLDAIV